MTFNPSNLCLPVPSGSTVIRTVRSEIQYFNIHQEITIYTHRHLLPMMKMLEIPGQLRQPSQLEQKKCQCPV